MIKTLMYVDLKELVADVAKDIAQIEEIEEIEEDEGGDAVGNIDIYTYSVYETLWYEYLDDYYVPSGHASFEPLPSEGQAVIERCVQRAKDLGDKTMQTILSVALGRLTACYVHGATQLRVAS